MGTGAISIGIVHGYVEIRIIHKCCKYSFLYRNRDNFQIHSILNKGCIKYECGQIFKCLIIEFKI